MSRLLWAFSAFAISTASSEVEEWYEIPLSNRSVWLSPYPSPFGLRAVRVELGFWDFLKELFAEMDEINSKYHGW